MRGPVMVDASVLTNVHVPPMFRELLVLLDVPIEGSLLVPLATARLRVTVAAASAVSKPVPPLAGFSMPSPTRLTR